MTDDDWFERALTDEERDEAEEGTEDGDGETAVAGEGADGAEPDASAATEEPDQRDAGGPDAEASGSADGDAGADGAGVTEDDGSFGDGPSEADEDDQLFDQDFASELQSADQPGGGGDNPFGDGEGFAGGDDAFGGGDDGFGGGGAFGGDGGAFGGGGTGGDDFGLGEMGAGGGETEFDEELEDSDIDRIDLGVSGLDEMIRGGVPDSSLMAAIGSAGTGKTTFGLQFIQHGLANGERAIYITLEESKERVVRSAEEKGWPFREHVEDGQLAVVDMDPIEMANSLSSIRSELPRLVDRFGASRLVLDSVSLLEMMYDDRATRRNEIYTFARSLKEAGVTILLTSEADEDNPYASRHGIVEYLTDAVYILQYVRPSDFRETRLAVEILKIRDAHHSREMKPYEITDDGLSVYRQANIF